MSISRPTSTTTQSAPSTRFQSFSSSPVLSYGPVHSTFLEVAERIDNEVKRILPSDPDHRDISQEAPRQFRSIADNLPLLISFPPSFGETEISRPPSPLQTLLASTTTSNATTPHSMPPLAGQPVIAPPNTPIPIRQGGASAGSVSIEYVTQQGLTPTPFNTFAGLESSASESPVLPQVPNASPVNVNRGGASAGSGFVGSTRPPTPNYAAAGAFAGL